MTPLLRMLNVLGTEAIENCIPRLVSVWELEHRLVQNLLRVPLIFGALFLCRHAPLSVSDLAHLESGL